MINKTSLKGAIALLFISLIASFAQAAVVEHNASITSDETWSALDTHYLGDYVFVENNATLTIEAGTTIYAYEKQGLQAPTLIVSRGAKIIANGTKEKPIIFTSVLAKDSNLTKSEKGKWGGLVILGDAPINSNGSNANDLPLTNQIEGVPTTFINGGSITTAKFTYG